MTRFTKVTKQEHDDFIGSYPRQLDRDVNRICEPPSITHNDFTRGKWPESVVASYSAFGYREDGSFNEEPPWGGVPGCYAIDRSAATETPGEPHEPKA